MICCCHHPGNLLSSVPAEFATCFSAASSLWVFNLPFVLIHLLPMVWKAVAHPVIVSACWLPGCGAGLRSYGNIPLLAGCSVALLACPTHSSLASCDGGSYGLLGLTKMLSQKAFLLLIPERLQTDKVVLCFMFSFLKLSSLSWTWNFL